MTMHHLGVRVHRLTAVAMLGLSSDLCQAVAELGLAMLMPVQARAIPRSLAAGTSLASR